MTWRDWLDQAEKRLIDSGDMDARIDAEWMLCDALQIGRGALRFALDEQTNGAALTQADIWLQRRMSGMPLQYAQRRAYFMGHEFYVDERVLIPRQDTERLAETAIELAKARGYHTALDLCTGSGAIGIALKLALPDMSVLATDLSGDAIAVAQENAKRLDADVEYMQGDLFAALDDRKFDLIVSNPPYINERDMANLQPEVRREPEMALAGGTDGLSFYRRIAADYQHHLNPKGALLLEIGYDQGAAVSGLLGEGAFLKQDLGGNDRLVGYIQI